MREKAFTLVELMIVVAILGILAAIVIPQIQGNTTLAKESTAKDTLRVWRSQIELYKMQHGGKAPGYKGPLGATVTELTYQFSGTSDMNGFAVVSQTPTAPYLYGPYLRSMPVNPFNNLDNIIYVPSATAFTAAADGTSSGWLYKKETAEIKLNWTGTDSHGESYSDY